MDEAETVQEQSVALERSQIAKLLLGASILGLVAVAIMVMWSAAKDSNSSVGEASQLVFNALLPLFGTWVGAVVAYYFSRENFESASRSVQAMAKQSALGRRLRAVAVREAMLAKAKMKLVQLSAEESEDESKVVLKTRLLDQLAGPVSRMPVLDQKGVARYMIHESLLFRFNYEAPRQAAVGDQTPGKQFDIETATLKDFLDHNGMRELVGRAMAFVPESGTLADAKAAMDKVADCRDVFVTKSGKNTEPVVGWIANTVFENYAEFE